MNFLLKFKKANLEEEINVGEIEIECCEITATGDLIIVCFGENYETKKSSMIEKMFELIQKEDLKEIMKYFMLGVNGFRLDKGDLAKSSSIYVSYEEKVN